MDETKIRRLDHAIATASKKINVLSALSWPAGVEEKFLKQWRAGHAELPKVDLRIPNVRENTEQLAALVTQCDMNDPAEKFLAETAESYAYAGRMLMAIGTPDFTRYSTKIYGRPDTPYKFQVMTAIDAARFFLETITTLLGNQHMHMYKDDHMTAEDFSRWLKTEVDEFFDHDAVEVVLDQGISAKALASGTRIRIRGNAVFSPLDKDQLLFHEAFVHTATQLNGRRQSNLTCLARATPRTTRTQEGLAVFAEMVTNVMDIQRLRRIALRVIAIKMALDGADFIEVFTFFVTSGQSEEESVRSAQRVFRGGAMKDKIVFTKDAMYLQGLFEIHTFLRLAIRDNRPDLVSNLFGGRLTMADSIRLSPLFDNGWLQPPAYMPPWARDLRKLSALMAYSAFASHIQLENINLDRAIEFEEALKATV